MEDSVPGPLLPATYQVVHDVELARQANLHAMRMQWKEWAVYGLKSGGNLITFGGITWIACSYFLGKQYNFLALAYTCAFCFAVGLALPLYQYIRAADKRERDPFAGSSWTCEMTEAGWSTETSDGLRIFYPWKLLAIEIELPDMWMIDVKDFEPVWVFRKPLRETGLEDEFRRRIETSLTESSSQST